MTAEALESIAVEIITIVMLIMVEAEFLAEDLLQGA